MSERHINEFGDAQDKIFTYIDWLYQSGRLTTEEQATLLDATVDCTMRAIAFGVEEVE